mmetsp:Transcript_55960/g.141697  ORF Transcript_55960/g.141697 Transcript_55960/m.141697 type:complete len:381 (+) Transcript_55960:347-1489(+)
MAGLFDGIHQHIQGFIVVLHARGKATLIAHIAGVLSIFLLDARLQVVVHLSSHDHRLHKTGRANWQDHKLLAGQAVARMAATIDHVHGRHRHHKVVQRLPTQLRNVLVQRHFAGCSSGAAHGHRDCQDRVGAELGLAPTPFVLGAIENLHHHLVDASLISHVHAHKLRGDDVVDVCDGLEHALAQESSLVVIAQFKGLIDARGGSAGNSRAEERGLGAEVHLDGWVAAGIEDLPCADEHDLVAGGSRIERRNSWQILALQQLQRGTAASAAMRDLVLGAILLARSRRVATSDHSDSAGRRHLHDLVHHGLGAIFKAFHLEHAHRAVPNDGLGLRYGSSVLCDGLRAAIQAHKALGHARTEGCSFDLPALSKLGGADEVHG